MLLSTTYAYSVLLAFLNDKELWDARVPNLTDDILMQDNRYEHVVVSRIGLAIGVNLVRVLIDKRVVVAWNLFQLSRNFDGTVFHSLFDEFGFIPPET